MSRKKIVIDAAGQAPGRIATQIATFLIGKHKVKYDPHIDIGDRVEVINATQVVFSGKKMEQKLYRHHSNHPGGLKEIPAKRMAEQKPENLIRLAVEKMLPKNKLRTQRLKRLTIKK